MSAFPATRKYNREIDNASQNGSVKKTLEQIRVEKMCKIFEVNSDNEIKSTFKVKING